MPVDRTRLRQLIGSLKRLDRVLSGEEKDLTNIGMERTYMAQFASAFDVAVVNDSDKLFVLPTTSSQGTDDGLADLIRPTAYEENKGASEMRCYGCGVEKDMNVPEKYPWPEDDSICDDQIPPLFVLEVEPHVQGDGFRAAAVCHSCFHRLDPYVWISERCWISILPEVPFGDLPKLTHSRTKVSELPDMSKEQVR